MSATIPTQTLLTMDRFTLIATWLEMTTRLKDSWADTGGLQVKRVRGKWVVRMPEVAGGKGVLFTGDVAGLFDYARRTALNSRIQWVEEARAQAFRSRSEAA